MVSTVSHDPVMQLLREGCRKKIFPGAVLCASRMGGVRYDHAVGYASLQPNPLPMVTAALFDVASLTKIVATTTALMVLVDAGEIEVEHPVSRYVPAFQVSGKEDITIAQLLDHSSGLPAHIKFYEELNALREKGEDIPMGDASMDWVVERIAQVEGKPPGTSAEYSDLGFLVLGRLIELVARQSLDQFCREQIFLPLGMEDTFFLPLYKTSNKRDVRRSRLKGRQIVATEDCPWRKRVLVGEVHDDNCYALGGVAGHAGLFSTGADLHRFAQMLLRCSTGKATFFPPSLVQEFWRIQDGVPGSTRTMGWDTPSQTGSSAGELFSRNSVGHLGFTGCSLWIDRDEEIIVVFLTNRVHPSRENAEIKRFRPLIHNSIYGLITTPSPLPPPKKAKRTSQPKKEAKEPAENELNGLTELTKSEPRLPLPPPPAPAKKD